VFLETLFEKPRIRGSALEADSVGCIDARAARLGSGKHTSAQPEQQQLQPNSKRSTHTRRSTDSGWCCFRAALDRARGGTTLPLPVTGREGGVTARPNRCN